jgi:hypothetical protein
MMANTNYTFDDVVMNYIPSDIETIDEAKKSLGNNFCLLFFRFYYIFYISTKYVHHLEIDENQLNKNFTNVLEQKSNESLDPRKDMKQRLIKMFMSNRDYLYRTFFIDNNIYFNIYFNNMIKYVLPLPFYLQIYTQMVTYRNNVDGIYDKNNIDYLDVPKDLDDVRQLRYNKPKNVDQVVGEINIHIDMKYFKDTIVADYYVFATKQHSYIANKVTNSSESFKFNILFRRDNRKFTLKNVQNGIPFELIAGQWESMNETIDVNKSEILYLVPMRKIIDDDVYKVFGNMTFSMTRYTHLFHSTGLEINIDKFLNLMEQSSYFHLTPYSSTDKYYKTRKCLVYQIFNDIDNMLDLTMSIVSMNPFLDNYHIYHKHKKAKMWKYIDYSQILKHYNKTPHNSGGNRHIPIAFNDNNHCVDGFRTDPYDFIKQRPYCDMDKPIYYKGRRRLQEIIYKTRKYDMSRLYVFTYNIDKYREMGYDIDEIKHYRTSYHPYVQPYYYVEDKNLKVCNQACIVYGGTYDSHILNLLNINGFFSTDFMQSYKSGGELLLSQPKKYTKLIAYSNKPCIDKNSEFDEILDDYDNYIYATIYKDDPNIINKLKAFGFTHKLSGSLYDILLLVPLANYNADKIWSLSSIFKVIVIDGNDDYLVKYMNTLTHYDKIIYINFNTIVLKNMDILFDNPTSYLNDDLFVLVPNMTKIKWNIMDVYESIRNSNKLEHRYREDVTKENEDTYSITATKTNNKYNDLIKFYVNKYNGLS